MSLAVLKRQAALPIHSTYRERGATLIELMISIAMLSVFSIAAMTVVTSGTAASADNRARITANGLAQRELDYASEVITGSSIGAKELLAKGEVANPNLPDAMKAAGADPDPHFAFAIDGQKYRVVRTAVPYLGEVKSPCNPGAAGEQAPQGTLVTVTVTWEGMSAATGAHVSSKVFPPQKGAATGMEAGQAQLVVRVTGKDASGAGGRQGIGVEVSGTGVTTPSQATNGAGCAVFLVKPEAVGSEYNVKLTGHAGGTEFLTPGRMAKPEQATTLKPGDSQSVDFQDYSQSARLTVQVAGAPVSVQIVEARPLFVDGGAPAKADLIGTEAKFESLSPGLYSIEIGGLPRGEVELAPGANELVTVVMVP
ncbi:MAG: type II secretion system GspH family protein [Bifidobacteriaceae bacterium]|nr:type II secretion system GspH family protein [Bifidobacteriaceae bacterium]